jgi:hypothetical protein
MNEYEPDFFDDVSANLDALPRTSDDDLETATQPAVQRLMISTSPDGSWSEPPLLAESVRSYRDVELSRRAWDTSPGCATASTAAGVVTSPSRRPSPLGGRFAR